MANIERIDSAYNIPAITAESDALQKLLERDTKSIVVLYENLEQFQNKSNVSNVAKNWGNVSNAIDEASASSQDMIKMQTQLNDLMAKNMQLEKQYEEAISRSTRARKSNKDLTDDEIRQNYENTKVTKDRTKEIIAQTDAYKQLDLQRAKAAERAKTLQAQSLKDPGNAQLKAEADEASVAANKLASALKKIDYSVGEQKRLVGDYTGALKVLEAQLDEVNAQIAAMEKAKASGRGVQNINPVGFDPNKNKPGEGSPTNLAGGNVTNFAIGFDPARFKELKQEREALNVVIGNQGKGFASSTKEIAQAEKSLRTLHAAGLENTQGFKELQKATVDAAREQKNFGEAEKLLEDNVPILRAITIAAKGLAATYAISQGAVTLFSDGNEKLEKELNKLIAIMTILQGLQEVHELLEKSNAIATIFKNSATKAGTILTGIDTKETIANAEAKTLQARATLEAATSEEAQAVAAEALTAAEAELTVATVAAAGATSTLVTVIGATGIGLLLIAVAAAVVYAVTKFKEWTAETELTIEQQKELTDSLTEQIDTLNKLNELRTESGAKDLDDLREQLSLEEKSGQNQYAIFLIKEKIAQKNTQLADSNYAQSIARAEDKYVKEGLTGIDALHKAQKDYFEDLTDRTYKVGVLQKELSNVLSLSDKERKQKHISKDDVEGIKARLESAKSDEKLSKSSYDYYTKTEKDKTDATNEQANLRAEIDKFSLDERRKYQLEVLKLETDDIKDHNDAILSDIRSSLSERLDAVKSNAEQERRVSNLVFQQSLEQFKNHEITIAEFREASAKHSSEINKINTTESRQNRDTVYGYYVRDRDAQVEIFKLQQQDRQVQSQKVLDDDQSSFDERHKALADFYESQRNEAGANFLKDIDQLGLTNEEKLKISDQYNSDLLKLNIDYEKKLQDEQKKEKDKQIKQLEDYYQKQKNILTGGQVIQSVGLNTDLLEGRVGADTYDRKKADLDFQHQKEQAQLRVQQAFAQAQMYKDGTKERSDAEAQLAQAQMDLSDLVTSHDLDNIKKRNELEQEAGQQTADTLVAIMGDVYDQQITNIEKTIKKDNQFADAQKKRIEDSTLGEQEKAQTVAYIQKQQDMNQRVLERREAEVKIKQARFNRDVAVAETIEQGAIAAIAALKIPVYGEAEAIAIGIITTAKVAEILARPLPTYGYGTEDHPGGPAWTGDLFEKEIIKEPGKAPYWSPAIPTVLDLPKHTQVIPMDEINRLHQGNLFVDNLGRLITVDSRRDDSKKIAIAINNQTVRLEKAIAKQIKVNVTIKQRTDPRWANHINDQVYK